jgi:hypothetical protein
MHPKPGLEYQRISIDRSKLSEDEAFEHAIEMISSRQMGFRKAADFFQVSKWKLYKTARKRGIYAEIKKQNQAHALSKVPTNVAHFAELGVYKQMRKKLPGTEKDMFPHLPRQTYPLDEDAKLMKTFNISNNNNSSSSNNNNISSAVNNNSMPGKHGFDKRDITFDKRYQDPIKPSFDPYFVDMKREAPGLGLGHKPYHGLDARLEQPIKLTKPLDPVGEHVEEEEDDDDDRLRLVIAHRENASPEDSDHESSESAEHSV